MDSYPRLNLMGAAQPVVSGDQAGDQTHPSIAQLCERYDAMCRARAIYYPVAFQFMRLLGKGRQGRVFLGMRQGARGCVTEHAIKVFDPSLYVSPEEYWTDMGRIASQISRLQRMQSPYLVRRSTYDETNGIGYVQMEAIDGLDLRQLLLPSHLPVARKCCTVNEWNYFQETIFRRKRDRLALQPGIVVYILRSCLKGLESIHSMNFLHSDVKPGNIMIDRLGTVKLVDFGRAVVMGERQGFLLGSPMYMAPELHRREVGTAQSDVYSLGIVAVEMLSGEPIAPESATEETLLQIKMALPGQLQCLLPPAVVENKELMLILQKLIAPDTAMRYATAKEAEVGNAGLRIVDKQLVRAGLDTEYARDLADYIRKLADDGTGRIEVPREADDT